MLSWFAKGCRVAPHSDHSMPEAAAHSKHHECLVGANRKAMNAMAMSLG
jgi:hypothetical protein